MKKTLIVLAILSPAVHADGDIEHFLRKSTHTFELKNAYNLIKSGRYDKTGNSNLLNWVQTASYDFKSPYINDTFGFDFGLYAIEPIAYGDKFYVRKALKKEVDKNGNITAKGFSKVSNASLKQQFNISDFDVRLYEGLRVLKFFGGVSRDGVVTSSSYYGITSEAISKHWNIKSGYLTQYSDANSSSRESLLTKDNKDIDYIYTVDARYQYQEQSFRAYIGEGQGYLRTYFLGYNTMVKSTKLEGKVFYVNALSKYKNMSPRNRTFDNSTYLAEIKSTFFFPSHFISVGYTYVSADKKGTLGRFDNNLSGNTKGNNDTIASGLTKDFYNNNESMVYLSYAHKVSDEVKVSIRGRYGFGFDYKGQSLDEYEIGAIIFYKPTQVKGLKLSLAGGPNRSFRRGFDNTPILNSKNKVESFSGTSLLAKVTYTF